MPTTYRTQYKLPQQQIFYWCPEMTYPVTPGTAGSGTAGTPGTKAYLEPCISFDDGIQRATYEDTEYRGFVNNHVDSVETTHHAELTIQIGIRPDGFVPYAIASLGGDITATGATEALATGVHTITPGPNGTRTNTFAFWFSPADSANLFNYVYGVVQSVMIQPDPNGIAVATIKVLCFFPTIEGDTNYVALPSGANLVKISSDRAYGYNGTYHVKNGAGSPADYAGAIISGSITIQRPADVFNSPNQQSLADPQSPYDFIQGPIEAVVQLSLYFTGNGANTAYNDFIRYKTLGGASAQHSVRFTDKSANYIEIDFWPAKWQPGVKLQRQGQALAVSGSLGSYQDAASATQVSPAVTAVASMSFKNSITTGMIA